MQPSFLDLTSNYRRRFEILQAITVILCMAKSSRKVHANNHNHVGADILTYRYGPKMVYVTPAEDWEVRLAQNLVSNTCVFTSGGHMSSKQ